MRLRNASRPSTTAPTRLYDRAARGLVLRSLRNLQGARLAFLDGDGMHEVGAAAEGERVQVIVHDPRFYRRLVRHGALGAGDAYVAGEWSCDDLVGLVRVLARNQRVLDEVGRRAGFSRRMRALLHRLRPNTRRGARRNVRAHYDLGNEFFELWLDPTMNYSCAYFERPGATLEEASIAKMERVCRKLDLRLGEHLLEIGTGWGALACHAAERYGVRVTTTTISRRQYERAVARVRERGLGGRVTVLLRDYRELEGTFDKLVSIEMIEAVGARYWDAYFRTCAERLRPDGRMLIQAITIADQRFERALRRVDFIQRYVFPGSCIPSLTALLRSTTRSSDLQLTDLEDVTPHYARTLQEWRAAFHANLEAVRELGYPESFVRLWDYYLAYCEGGFAERAISDVQLVLSKPACPVPWTRPEARSGAATSAARARALEVAR